MSDSCWVHAFSMILRFGVELEVFAKILVQIWLGRGWCWITIHADLIFTWNFRNALCNILHHNGVEFMFSCWIHAEFKQNRDKYLNLPIKWHLKHLTGLLMLYTIRNTVWDFSKKKLLKLYKKHLFLTDLLEFRMNSAWIQHHCYAKCCTKHCEIPGQNEISMKSAWIQHESDMNSTPIWSQLLYTALWNSGWTWNQNEISMNSAWIQHQSDFTKRFWWW